MHIEKNICDNLIGTLLSIDGKNKATEKVCMDLEDMKIRKDLHLKRHADGSLEKPIALYTFSLKERQGFCEFLKSIRYPDGYAANISKCVSTKGGKLSGLKSHDCHGLIQRLLPIGMRGYLNKDISIALFELGNYFQQLCSKTVRVNDLEKLQESIVLILRKLGKKFPPTFFDVMVHLAIHLPHETILGGPVQYRWMYPIEREERNEDGGDVGSGRSIFSQKVRTFGLTQRAVDVSENERTVAHWFILYNSPEIDEYLEEHKNQLQNANVHDITRRQQQEFPRWFKKRVAKGVVMRVYRPEFADALILSCSYMRGVFEILGIGQI